MVTVSDDFTGADSPTAVWNDSSSSGRVTPVGGKTWIGVGIPLAGDDSPTQLSGGGWGITANKCTRSSNENAYVFVDTGDADGTFDVELTTGTVVNDSGIAFRYLDTSNWLRIIADPGGWYLQRRIAGTNTNIAHAGAAAANTVYPLKVVLAGPSIKFYVNSVLTLDLVVSDTPILTATKVGFYNSGGGTTHKWDSFSWTPPPPPPTPPGVPTAVTVDSITATAARLKWSAPATGDAPTDYDVRITEA